MGSVFEIWDPTIERPLAMKVLHKQDSNRTATTAAGSAVARFLNEAQITGQINHPGVAPVHEIASDEEGRIFFTMQVVEGLSLHEILCKTEEERLSEGWTPTRLINILLKVCDTIAYAHSKNIIHRDLKPANIMIGQFGETYVMDWGLAKRIEAETDDELGIMTIVEEGSQEQTEIDPKATDSRSPTLALTLEGAVLGTPMYMPPEQASGHVDELGFACDIYAVGAILYHVLSGHPPFADRGFRSTAKLIEAVRAEAPTPLDPSDNLMSSGELVAICEKAMARSIDDRYENMLAMSSDLRAFLENRVVTAYQTGAWAELKKWVVRNRGISIATACALLVATCGISAILLIQAKSNSDLSIANERIKDEQGKTNLSLKKEKEAHRLSRSLSLASESSRILTDNPGSALLVALEAADRAPSAQANTAIYQALDQSREIHTFDSYDGTAKLSKDGSRVASITRDHHIAISDAMTGRRVALLVGHSELVHDIRFDSRRDRLFSISEDGMAGEWDLRDGRLVRWFTEPGKESTHEIKGSSIALSTSGNFLATGGSVGDIKIWNLNTGQLETSGHTVGDNRIRRIAFSTDDKSLLYGSNNGSAQCWAWENAADPILLETSQGDRLHQGGISHIAVAEDSHGNFLTVAGFKKKFNKNDRADSTENTCYVWNSQGELQLPLRHPIGSVVTAAAFTPDGLRLVTCADDGFLRIWSAENGVQEGESIHASNEPLLTVEVSRDGKLIVTAGLDKIARVWDLESGSLVRELRGHEKEIVGAEFTPEGKRVLTYSRDNTARLWRVKGRSPLPILNDGIPITKSSYDPTRANRVIALTDEPLEIKVWDASNMTEIHSITAPPETFQAICSEDGKYLIAATKNGQIHQWSADTGKPVRKTDLNIGLTHVENSADGKFLVARSTERDVVKQIDLSNGSINHFESPNGSFIGGFSSDGKRVIERDGGTFLVREFGNEHPIANLNLGERIAIKFSPRGKLLTWWHEQKTSTPVGEEVRFALRLTDLDTDSTITLNEHRHFDIFPDFSRDSERLVTASADRAAILWNTSDGSVIRKFPTQPFPINSCSISNDGKRVLTFCNQEESPRLWDADTGENWILARRDRLLKEAVFSPGNRFVATTTRSDSRVALWSTSNGELIALLPGTEGEQLSRITFSADESWILTRSVSGIARIWPTDIRSFAAAHLPRELTPHEREIYQISTPDELREIEGRLAIKLELETLRLMEQATGQQIPSPRVVETFRASARRIGTATTVDSELRTLAKEELLRALGILGKGDPESHLHVTHALTSLGAREAAQDAVRRGLAFTKIDPNILTELESLQKSLAEAAN